MFICLRKTTDHRLVREVLEGTYGETEETGGGRRMKYGTVTTTRPSRIRGRWYREKGPEARTTNRGDESHKRREVRGTINSRMRVGHDGSIRSLVTSQGYYETCEERGM